MCTKEVIDIIKASVEIAAYLAALLFFVYKVYAGYLVIDMSISLDCERKRKLGTDKDYLGISVALKKGERGGVELHDAQVRITSCNTDQVLGPFPLTTITRVNRTESPQASGGAQHSTINWLVIPTNVPRLKMPPGDESKLAAFAEVDAGVPYMVEAVVLARKLLWRRLKVRFGQWRAAKVSLPS